MDHRKRRERGARPAGAAPRDPIAIARRLVRTPSVNPVLEEGGAGEEEVARLAAAVAAL